MKKNLFSIILVFILIISVVPVTAFADITADASGLVLSGETTFLDDGIAGLYKNDCATFDTEINESGYYRVKLQGTFKKGTIINLSVNNLPVDNISVPTDTEILVFFADLPQGDVSVAFNVAKGEVRISSVSLAMSDKELADEMVACINGAELYSQVKNIFERFRDPLALDMSVAEKDIFYPDCAYGRLIGKEYSNINRLLEDIIAYLGMERANPQVILSNGSETLTSFESSKLKLNIPASLWDEGVTIAAVYSSDGSLYKALPFDDKSYGNIEMELDLSDEPQADSFTFKLFYWNNIEALRPINRFGEVYRDIYLSPDGSDTNSGDTPDEAFATLERVKEELMFGTSSMKGDIVVHIASGEYFVSQTEDFAEMHGGKNGYRVIFRGEGDTRPVFTGGKKITGWTEHENGIYKAPFDGKTSLRELWVDGLPAVRARGDYIYKYDEDYSDTSAKAFITDGPKFPHLSKPSEAELVWQSMWSLQRTAVSNISLTDDGRTLIELDDFYQPDSLISTCKIQKNGTFYIENALELLDREGEFFHDVEEGMIYYLPPKGTDMDNPEVYAPVTEGLFRVSGSDITNRVCNISFENLSFRHGTWTYPNDNSLISVQAGSSYHSSGTSELYPPAQFTVQHADGIVIKNCEFRYLGTNAVAYIEGVTGCNLSGNIISDVGGGAVSVGDFRHGAKNLSDDTYVCKNINISDNFVRRTAFQYMNVPAFTMYYGNGIKILNNDIKDTAYTGISLGWGWDSSSNRSPNTGRILVENNRVCNVMRTLGDGANIYTLGYLPDTLIQGNWFDFNMSNPKWKYPGIYLDEGTRYVSAIGNVVTNCNSRWLFINSTQASLDADIHGNYSDGTEVGNKSGSQLGENNDSLTEMPQEALDIINNAGITHKYSHNIENTEPAKETLNLYYDTPSGFDEEGICLHALDYVKGTVTANAENYISFNPADNVTYSVNISEEATYSFVLYAGSASSNNVPFAFRITDENETVDKYFWPVLTPNGSFGKYESTTLAQVKLSPGTYNVWIRNNSDKGAACHINRIIVK